MQKLTIQHLFICLIVILVLADLPALADSNVRNVFEAPSAWTLTIAGEEGVLKLPGGKYVRTPDNRWVLAMKVEWQGVPGKFQAVSGKKPGDIHVRLAVESPRDNTRFHCEGTLQQNLETMSGKCRWGRTGGRWHATKQASRKPSPPVSIGGCIKTEKTLYEGIVRYKLSPAKWWIRCGGKIENRPDAFFPEINTYTPQIKSLVIHILGYRPNRTQNDKEIWGRVVKVWNWLRQNQLTEANVNYRKAQQYIDRLDSWPSIANIAHMYEQYNGIWWGSCMSRAQMFATLLYIVGIPPDRFTIAESYWKPEYSQHMFVILYINNRWLYLDPTYIVQVLYTDDVTSVGSGSADYVHPREIILLPGSTLPGVPLVH